MQMVLAKLLSFKVYCIIDYVNFPSIYMIVT